MSSDVNYKKLIREEYVRCARDPIYFFKKYIYISHPTKGKIKFDTYRFQELAFDQLVKNDYNVILKARQMGLSTLTAAYALWLMLFQKDKKVLIIATKQDVAKNLVTKVRYAQESLPKWLRGTTIEDNKLSLVFANGSSIKAVASSPDAGRSESVSLLVLDECAFIDYIDDIWASAQQTLATGGKCIALSTPNGMGGWFHKTWNGAKDGTNRFNTINLHWSLHPDRDQAWRDEQDDVLGPKLAAQECDCSFMSSGDSIVPGDVLEWYRDTHVCDPIEKRGMLQSYWLWEYPDYAMNYIVSADVARGDASDFSTFNVLEVETLRQVASFKAKIDTKEFGRMLTLVGSEWNNALVVVENANVGWATLQEMIDIGYPNIFYSSKDMQVVDTHYAYINKRADTENPTTPGFTTSTKTRPMLISKLDEYVRKKDAIIKDTRLIDELFTFIWKGQRAEAMGGYHDDLVMSYAIALWVRDTALKLRMESMEMTRQALNGIQRTTTSGVFTPSSISSNPYTQEIKGEVVDFRWLFDK